MVPTPSPLTAVTYAALLTVALLVYRLTRGELRSLGRRLGVTRRVAVPVFALAGVGFVELWRRGTVPTDGSGELPFALAGAGYLPGVILIAVALGNAPTLPGAADRDDGHRGPLSRPGVGRVGRAVAPAERPGGRGLGLALTAAGFTGMAAVAGVV